MHSAFCGHSFIPTYLPTDGYICTKSRSMYNKWRAIPVFFDLLTTFDDYHQTTSTAIDDITDEAERSGESMDETSSDKDSMNNDCNLNRRVVRRNQYYKYFSVFFSENKSI
jgi:hypothetical protein